MNRRLKALVLLPIAVLLIAADLTVSKTSAVVSDPQGNLLPKRVPGAVIDYSTTVTNPNGVFTTVNGVTFSDAIPARTELYVGDLGLLAGSGPVVFEGLSLLTYGYTSLGSTTDRLDFSNNNGATWTYVPNGGTSGYDANVTNIRVRLGGNHLAGAAFTIRFRVRIR